jgi:hypothetical protein
MISVRNMVEKHQLVQLLAPVQLLNPKCISNLNLILKPKRKECALVESKTVKI